MNAATLVALLAGLAAAGKADTGEPLFSAYQSAQAVFQPARSDWAAVLKPGVSKARTFSSPDGGTPNCPACEVAKAESFIEKIAVCLDDFQVEFDNFVFLIPKGDGSFPVSPAGLSQNDRIRVLQAVYTRLGQCSIAPKRGGLSLFATQGLLAQMTASTQLRIFAFHWWY